MVLSVTKWLFGFLAVLVIVILFYAFALPRPADTTDPAIFMKDGGSLNYCDLPVLDGSGKSANDIPKAYTPGCSYTTIPMPILAECTEPLAEGVVDMRGLWLGISDGDEHLERIEQCGNRVVITAFGIVHDFRVDGTLKNGARDVGIVCNNFNSAIHFDEEGVMVFRLFDLFDTVFREMRNEQMIFTFINGNEISTKRICQYQ
ncbi:MAG: hypothetical protein VX720_03075 [Pseudomonadota bacterium]|nr:hypothetical protein [Pseudomonadota bacterium]